MRHAKPAVLCSYQGSRIPKTFIKEPNLAPPTLDAQSRVPNNGPLCYYYPDIFPVPRSSVLSWVHISFPTFHHAEVYSNRTKRFLRNIYIYHRKWVWRKNSRFYTTLAWMWHFLAKTLRNVTGDLEIATSLLSLPDQMEINSIIRTTFQKKIWVDSRIGSGAEIQPA